MELKEIQDLIRLTSKLGVKEVEVEKDGFKLTIKTEKGGKTTTNIIGQMPGNVMANVPSFAPAPTQIAEVASPAPSEKPSAEAPAQEKSASTDESKYLTIKSPMIGTFYRSSSPDKDPFAKIGDTISSGQVVCIIEAMKLFNEIESEISGEIVKILVDNASPVEYDQPLFLVNPS